MLQVAQLTAGKVTMLLIFIAVGYLLRVSGKLPENATKVLSTLAATIFTPAYTMRNLASQFTPDKIVQNAIMLGFGVLFCVICVAAGNVLARTLSKDPTKRKSLTYAFTFPNYGYFGYPVIEGVFGSAMLSQVLVFVLPLSILTNTYGYLLFVPNGKLSVKRVFLSPPVLGVLIGMVLGLTELPLPGVVDDVLAGAAACMSPVAMLLAGFVLGAFPLKKLLTNGYAYLIGAIRLLGIPVVLGAVLWLMGLRDVWLLFPALIASLPLGLNLVVYPESQGIDASDNARLCCVSYLLSIITLPVLFSILGTLAMG